MDPLAVVGNAAPPFTLEDIDGNLYELTSARGTLVILNFWSAECPWSAFGDKVLSGYQQEWGDRVNVWTIASNANEEPNLIRQVSAERGLAQALRDPDHHVADLYNALTTPHLFLIDQQGILRYDGALDDRTFRRRTADRFYLQDAVEAVLAGGIPDPTQTPPYGCTIVRFSP